MQSGACVAYEGSNDDLFIHEPFLEDVKVRVRVRVSVRVRNFKKKTCFDVKSGKLQSCELHVDFFILFFKSNFVFYYNEKQFNKIS